MCPMLTRTIQAPGQRNHAQQKKPSAASKMQKAERLCIAQLRGKNSKTTLWRGARESRKMEHREKNVSFHVHRKNLVNKHDWQHVVIYFNVLDARIEEKTKIMWLNRSNRHLKVAKIVIFESSTLRLVENPNFPKGRTTGISKRVLRTMCFALRSCAEKNQKSPSGESPETEKSRKMEHREKNV